MKLHYLKHTLVRRNVIRDTVADIATREKIAPEEISLAKIYPRLALASIAVIEAEYVFHRTCQANRGTKIRKTQLALPSEGRD